MNDRTITRACRAGAKTVPVDGRPRPKEIRGDVTLDPDELALALELARADRIEQQIRDYKHLKESK